MMMNNETTGQKEHTPNILIVDDKPDNLRILCDILIEQRWKVRPVSSGKLALQAALANPPDVILLDIMMPEMDGFQVCRHLKNSPATHHIPIVMVTALTDKDSKIMALEAGADEFLSKPVDASELVVRTRNLLRIKLYGDLLKQYNGSLEEQVAKRTEELETAYEALKSTQSKLMQQEKMASMGLLMAGIAHEINNPVGFISSNLETLANYGNHLTEFISIQDSTVQTAGCAPEQLVNLQQQRDRCKVDRILKDFPNLMQESQEGIDRVKQIVRDMKQFSRADDDTPKLADINQCLESTLNLVRNELKYKATVSCDFAILPQAICLPHRLNQVFMNLLINAAHAIEIEGEIKVRTWLSDNRIHASISDTGCGIPAELKERIFEPFFTTKEPGKGTGLGLSISYDIIRKHGGEILVESKVGSGTTFTVTIPVNGNV